MRVRSAMLSEERTHDGEVGTVILGRGLSSKSTMSERTNGASDEKGVQ